MVGYVTIAEADAYVESRYSSTSDDRARWEGLSEEDKEVFLMQSIDALDMLPYRFRKTSPSQPHAFPRKYETTVPVAVKHAQIENAIKLSSEEDNSQYEKMALLGVESYSIGNLSEKLSPGATRPVGVVSLKALKLLTPYLSGGYRI